MLLFNSNSFPDRVLNWTPMVTIKGLLTGQSDILDKRWLNINVIITQISILVSTIKC